MKNTALRYFIGFALPLLITVLTLGSDIIEPETVEAHSYLIAMGLITVNSLITHLFTSNIIFGVKNEKGEVENKKVPYLWAITAGATLLFCLLSL